MNVCIYQQKREKNIYISWGGPLFSLSGHIFRTLPFSIFGGDWKKKWGNTESKKKKKKPPCLSLHPPQQSLPSDVCLRKSPSRFLPSFGVLFSLSFLLPILFPFFSLPLKLRFHTIIYSLPHSLVFLPHLVSVFPQSNLLREKREKIKIKKNGKEK